MEDRQDVATPPTDEADLTGRLWPSPAYTRQVEALKRAIGEVTIQPILP